MLQAVVVMAFAGLGIQRISEVVTEILSPVVPARIGGTGLAGSRVVLWIMAIIFGYIGVVMLGYDPLSATGIAEGAAPVWNILYWAAITDAVDSLWRRRILRA